MAITVVGRTPSIGERLGTGLGTGLSQGITALAEDKLKRLQSGQKREQVQQALIGLGLPPQEAAAVSGLPQNLQAEYIKNMRKRTQRQSMQQLLGGLVPEENAPAGVEQSLIPGLEPAEVAPTAGLLGVHGVEQPSQAEPAERGVVDIFGGADIPIQQQLQVAQMKQKERMEVKRRAFEEKKFAQKKESEEKKLVQKKKAEERKISIKEQTAIDKETAPVYKEIIKKARVSRESEKRLGRIEELNEKGYLGFPIVNSVLKAVKKGVWGIGLDLTALMTADAQELDKLSTDFLKNVKDIFGARITDREVQLFLQTIPTLSQTKSGRTKLIRNLRSFDKGSEIRNRVMNEIIKENNGRRPRNLEHLIDQRAEPELTALSDEFKKGPVGPGSYGEGLLWY